MKRLTIFVLVLLLLTGAVSASVIVNNFTLKENYFLNETISGKVNLTIVDEAPDLNITTNTGDSINLEDFLIFNGAGYTCKPLDCGQGYNSLSSGSSKTISVATGNDYYFGLVLQGSGVRLSSLDFDIGSDFAQGIDNPLAIDFFEGAENWRFNEFSNSFTARYYGCYDNTSASPGPLIRTSTYCEMIGLKETGKIEMGAIVDNSDTDNLRMTVYPESGGSSLGSCIFNPTSEESCVVEADLGEVFDEGSYQICVSADAVTDYKLYSESVGSNCGFVKSLGPSNSTKDYGIFAKTAKYKNASSLNSGEFDFSDLAIAADTLLEEKYDRDCSNNCYLPIKVRGVNQNLVISNLNAELVVAGEDQVYNSVHQLGVIPTKIDFSGILDFRLLGFKAKQSGTYKINLGSTNLGTANIKITATPVIKSVTPLNPPAGVPVSFFASVDFGAGLEKNLTYVWTFGDGKTNTTKTNNITHIYPLISNYSLKLKVSHGNLSSEKVFLINTVSPKSIVNSTLDSKSKELSEFFNQTKSFPTWYKDVITKEVKYDFFKGEIDRLKKAVGNAATDSDYIKIATDLYALDIPHLVYSEKEINIGLIEEAEYVDPQVIASFSGTVSPDLLEEYKQVIVNWQIENTDSRITSDTIYLEKSSGIKSEIMRVYDVYVISKESYSESYFVIGRPFDDVFIEGDISPKKVDESTLIVLNPNEETNFKFYTINGGPTNFFVSPRLSSLVLEAVIDTSCNFNGFCEDGEDSNTCRSDCKPTKKLIFYLIILFIVFLVAYTIMQIWYDRRYESHLFEDRRYLFNLLMYIANEKARGKNYSQILGDLKQKGWSREQLNYAILKSEGKRTGLPEIIPISKILASRRNKAAQKEIATSPKQQTGRNINKFDFQKP